MGFKFVVGKIASALAKHLPWLAVFADSSIKVYTFLRNHALFIVVCMQAILWICSFLGTVYCMRILFEDLFSSLDSTLNVNTGIVVEPYSSIPHIEFVNSILPLSEVVSFGFSYIGLLCSLFTASSIVWVYKHLITRVKVFA